MRGHVVAVAALSLAALSVTGTPLSDAAAGTKTVTVTGKEFSFAPERISGTPGSELVITFRNEGKLSHNLTFPALEVSTGTIQAGETKKVRVTVNEEGSYSFICTVPGHKEAGMHGDLRVR
jgi:uncharacterized cupredoxin-like copper-binding protein